MRCLTHAPSSAVIQARLSDMRRREEMDAARRRAEELPDWFEVYNRLEPDLTKAPPTDL